jgi:hypothetical protein
MVLPFKAGVLGLDGGLLGGRVVAQCFGGVGAAEGGGDPCELVLPVPGLVGFERAGQVRGRV